MQGIVPILEKVIQDPVFKGDEQPLKFIETGKTATHRMKIIFLSLFQLLFSIQVLFGQQLPEVTFNHMYYIISPGDLKAINNSPFVKEELVGFETKTTFADSAASWTGTYLVGEDNYFEIFDSISFNDKTPEGFSGIGFSTNNVEELQELKSSLQQKYNRTFKTEFVQRQVENEMIPWFHTFEIHDSIYYNKANTLFWIMAYQKEYFDHMSYNYKNNEFTKRSYLKDKESDRKGKIIKRFSGVTLNLSELEKSVIIAYFENVGYQKLNDNQFMAPENFRFTINLRSFNEKNTLDKLEFETSRAMEPQKLMISENVSVTIQKSSGWISFR